MKTAQQRLNNIIGQLEGAKRMLKTDSKSPRDDQADCFATLVQLKAAKSALSALMDMIVENEFNRCLAGPERQRKERIEKIFKEIIKK